MSTIAASDPVTACEAILREEFEHNQKTGTWPSVNAVIQRFFDRRDELVEAYRRLHTDLSHHPNALRRMLSAVVDHPAIWGLDTIAAAQDAFKRLIAVNRDIAQLAQRLTCLLLERSELENDFSLHGNTHYHIVDVIEGAGMEQVYFNGRVREPLSALSRQFGLKYWPSLADSVAEIGFDADQAEVQFTDPIMKAATTTSKVSKAAFLRGLIKKIDENSQERYGPIPSGYRPDDETLASLVNCSLDLSDDEIIDAVYVKRFRQEERRKRPD